MAIALGAAIPQGWMPARAASNDFSLMICSQGMPMVEQERIVAQLRATFGDTLGQSDAPDDSDDPAERCPYGVVAHSAAIDGPGSDPISPPERTPELLGSVPEATTGQGLAAPPPPATGPPLTF